MVSALLMPDASLRNIVPKHVIEHETRRHGRRDSRREVRRHADPGASRADAQRLLGRTVFSQLRADSAPPTMY